MSNELHCPSLFSFHQNKNNKQHDFARCKSKPFLRNTQNSINYIMCYAWKDANIKNCVKLVFISVSSSKEKYSEVATYTCTCSFYFQNELKAQLQPLTWALASSIFRGRLIQSCITLAHFMESGIYLLSRSSRCIDNWDKVYILRGEVFFSTFISFEAPNHCNLSKRWSFPIISKTAWKQTTGH